METGERIRTLREQLGMSRAALARRVGVTDSHIYGVEKGKSDMSVPVLRAIAEALAISADVLNGDAPMPDEKVHKAKKRMAFLLEEVTESEAATGLPAASVILPVLGSVAAGRWEEALANPDETAAIPLSEFPADMSRDQAFFLRVRGDSMIGAGILDGDLVLVQPTPDFRETEIVVVADGGEAVCKFVSFAGPGHTAVLLAANPAYPPLLLSEESRIIGVVRGVHRKIGRR